MLYRLARPLFFALDAERAHDIGLAALEAASRCGLSRLLAPTVMASPVQIMGLHFRNRVGLAAGLDKNAAHVDALAALGFGFIEVGTVTPRPQPGNPRPRLFRVPQADGLINRMGFNNDGVERVLMNLRRARYRGVLGINIGKNFDTPIERAQDDYVHCLRRVYAHASYVAVNVSSPNTKDLRSLQQAPALDRLLAALARERDALADQHGHRLPLAVKIAPDLEPGEIDDIAKLVTAHRFDAVIATNTTIARQGIAGTRHAGEAGGLSGAPLRARSTEVIRHLDQAFRGRVPIIGVGGVFSGEHALEKIAAGAALVQIYTGLIYRGPSVIAEAARALAHIPGD